MLYPFPHPEGGDIMLHKIRVVAVQKDSDGNLCEDTVFGYQLFNDRPLIGDVIHLSDEDNVDGVPVAVGIYFEVLKYLHFSHGPDFAETAPNGGALIRSKSTMLVKRINCPYTDDYKLDMDAYGVHPPKTIQSSGR